MSRMEAVPVRFEPNRRRKRADAAKTAVVMVAMIAAAVYFLFPLYWLFLSSTKSTADLFNTPILLLSPHPSLAANFHWLNIQQSGIYWRWFLNSIVYSGVTGVLGTLISALAGYALAKYTFRLQGAILRIVIGGLAIPSAALTIPVFLLVKHLGLINTYAGVILPMLVSPFGVYFMSVYIRDAMPSELIDSGRVDGAGDLQIFARIALAIMLPGVVTLFLITFIGTWNNFFMPLVLLSSQQLFPVTLGLDLWVATLGNQTQEIPVYPLIMVGSVISVLPMLVLFPFLRKYIISGITLGGIKS
ncbi:carbohydrate ABC transporter permease [Paenibacillus humicola]|uniref:carbohydrate ABC transporter permease n=1 Tax=Paenibacillus humicola TaxID=3110540 RepID=UPI00237A465A|nr:carbohydrate ABC transporter permease [Paenibacillus humicola]